MPDFLKCLGYDTSNPQVLQKLMEGFTHHLSAQMTTQAKYYYWRNRQGIELWLGSENYEDWQTFNPHFRSHSLQKGILTGRFASKDSTLDGLFMCQFGMSQDLVQKSDRVPLEDAQPKLEGFPLLFRPPNFHWFDHVPVPSQVILQMIGFPDSVEIFPRGTKSLPSGSEKPDVPMFYLVPVGPIAHEQDGVLYPLVEFGGVIQTLSSFENPASHNLVFVATVETVGITIDVLIPADMVPTKPEPGMVIQTKCWLSGKVIEAFESAAPTETAAQLFFQETPISGTYYHNLGERYLDFFFWDPLVLVRERDNPHDPLAVAVLTPEGEKVGYIPRECNHKLAELMDQGAEAQARIVDKAMISDHMDIDIRVYTRGAFTD
ncbi:MAG: HIRAN domain-containing protein [Anaerolineaceae bacterium]